MLGFSIFPILLLGCEKPSFVFEPVEINGIVYRHVPSGTYILGSHQDVGQSDEHPQIQVEINGFWMMEKEVTNLQMSEFLTAMNFQKQTIKAMIGLDGDSFRPTEIQFTGSRYRASYGYEDHPVMTVTYRGAEAYCQSIGARLPTEFEWEVAARGGLEDALYPWGNEPPEGRAHFAQEWRQINTPAPTIPVGSYPPNAYGLYDMSGSVWEWTQTLYHNYKNQQPLSKNRVRTVVRGGSWGSPADEVRVAFRRNYEINIRSNFLGGLGVRCVKDKVPS